jgi:hypothetical protein
MNARKFGIYGKLLTEDEKKEWVMINPGNLDSLLRIAYFQHKRALAAARYDEAERLLGRIANLEKTKKELEGKTPKDQKTVVNFNIVEGKNVPSCMQDDSQTD